jgi:hypothetical protein
MHYERIVQVGHASACLGSAQHARLKIKRPGQPQPCPYSPRQGFRHIKSLDLQAAWPIVAYPFALAAEPTVTQPFDVNGLVVTLSP